MQKGGPIDAQSDSTRSSGSAYLVGAIRSSGRGFDAGLREALQDLQGDHGARGVLWDVDEPEALVFDADGESD